MSGKDIWLALTNFIHDDCILSLPCPHLYPLLHPGMPQGHIPDYYQYLESFSNPKANNTHHMLRVTPPLHGSRTVSETDSIQKATWEFEYPNILDNYMDGKNSLLVFDWLK